ncbi:MAG: hypothetical protein MJY82_10870 [Fibrobacter sp.]|nr:hypothetical protein [Fibrobacter sp.]
MNAKIRFAKENTPKVEQNTQKVELLGEKSIKSSTLISLCVPIRGWNGAEEALFSVL